MKKLLSNHKYIQEHCGSDEYTWALYRERLWYIASYNKEEVGARNPILTYSLFGPTWYIL
jgi:hypothetical protein